MAIDGGLMVTLNMDMTLFCYSVNNSVFAMCRVYHFIHVNYPRILITPAITSP